MKKKIVILSGVLALLAGAGMAVTSYQKANSEFSSLLLKNAEALAETESGTGTCGSTGWTGDSWATVCNVSKDEAMVNFDWWDTPHKYWCCDSCSSTSYCGSGS